MAFRWTIAICCLAALLTEVKGTHVSKRLMRKRQTDTTQCEKDAIQLTSANTDVAVSVQVPELSALTACMWAKSEQKDRTGTLVSYAVDGRFNNFLLFDTGNIQIYIVEDGEVSGLNINDGEWHFVCVTWSSIDGSWAIYDNGTLFNSGTGLSTGRTITGLGSLVVGQEQDTMRGGYDPTQAFIGTMAYFNMWSGLLSDDVIRIVQDCSSDGDVVSWNITGLDIRGDVDIVCSDLCGSKGKVIRDPHLTSFDGRHFNFQGSCWYTIAAVCSKDVLPFFEVVGLFEPRPYSPGSEIKTRTVRVVVTCADESVTLNKDNTFAINGNSQSMDTNTLKITQTADATIVRGDGFTVVWKGREHTVNINLEDNRYHGHMCGLLGNNDGDPMNDFIKSDGSMTDDIDEFGESWKVPGLSCQDE